MNFNQIFLIQLTKELLSNWNKDKCKGISINKFILLKSKMYCFVSDDDAEVNTAKGVNISVEFNEH